LIGIVIAAHGRLAESLREAATTVLGDLPHLIAISVDTNEGAGSILEQFQQAVKSVKQDSGVLILTDMFGGTPSNIGLTLHDGHSVEVLTGVNLPMLIKASQLSYTDISLVQAADIVREIGLKSITIASNILGTP